ncbi:MFS transporter [Sneathiella limimaris]|uniref:MFS transporter n=1 Tax=Sneathiella limimaris TaxID=1964213 RepID=UPI00146D3494|nr:MFS transporter [Sneathiella limimaris]
MNTLSRGKRYSVFITLTGLYVMQAIPIYLFGAAIPVILRDQGVNLATIGSMALLFLPWVLKFLWAPCVDRWKPPFLGPRKGWIIPSQISICGLIFWMANLDPADNLFQIFVIACIISFLSATQDIATDGYAVELLEEHERPLGNGIQGGSVAIGVILGGTATLMLYEFIGWTGSIMIAGGAGLLFLLPVFFIADQTTHLAIHNKEQVSQASIISFLKRPEARYVLYLVLAYRVSEGFVKAMEQTFMKDQGLSLSTIGLVSGGSAAIVGLAGSILGAYLVKKMSAAPFLLFLAFIRTIVFIGFSLAAHLNTQDATILVGLSVANTFVRYMEIVGIFNLCMQVCHKHQAGTDFTILSCANLFVYMCGSMISGFIADGYGYGILFTFASILSFAGVFQAYHFIQNQRYAYLVKRQSDT